MHLRFIFTRVCIFSDITMIHLFVNVKFKCLFNISMVRTKMLENGKNNGKVREMCQSENVGLTHLLLPC